MAKPIQIADLSTSTVQSIETLVLPLAVAEPMARALRLDERRDAAEARTAAPQPPSADSLLFTYWVAG